MAQTAITISAGFARTCLGSLLKQARNNRRRFIITKNGEPNAVLLGVSDFDDMLEELDPEFQQSLKEAAAEHRAGKAVPLRSFLRGRSRKRSHG
jgi:prevent-host-death family protein